jgi:hypothetical protein
MRIDRLKGLESLNTSTNVNQVPMVVHIHEQHPMVIEDGKDRTSKGRDWQQHHLIHPWPMLFALPQALPQVFRHQQEASDHREPGPNHIPTFAEGEGLRLAIIMDPYSAPPMLTWPGKAM